jgi:hypothetical protein
MFAPSMRQLIAVQRPTWSRILNSPTHTLIAHRGQRWTGREQDIWSIHVHMMMMTHYLIL